MIWEGCRTHRTVTGPMNFKKSGRFFFRKVVLPGLWGPGCHPSTLIDNANTVLASKASLKTKYMITEGYRTHRGVAGPKSFKESGRFLSEIRAPGILGPLAAIRAP